MKADNIVWVIECYDNWGEREVKVCRDRASALRIAHALVKSSEHFGCHLDFTEDEESEDGNFFTFIMCFETYKYTIAGYESCFEDCKEDE